MLEASAVATAIPSLWSAVNSWFTPAVLFLLLNLMIATIAFTSSLTPTNPPSHHIPAYPQENHHHQEQHHQEEDEELEQGPTTITTKHSPPISIIDRVKSLGLFSPRKSPQKQEPSPLIPLEEVDGETSAVPMDPFEKQGHGQHESPSTAGKFEAFDLYRYLPQEPAPEIPQESNPAHYIFESTHPQEVLVLAGRDEKVEEEGEEEDGEAEEKEEEGEEEEEEEEEETREGDGSEEKIEREAPNLLLQRGLWRSESLNVKFSFSNLREEEGRVGGGLEEGDMVEKRRPVTMREGKGKWGGGGGGGAGVDEEVDARADDFINRFKQQLKLQRMDSLARQKDVTMISKVRSF